MLFSVTLLYMALEVVGLMCLPLQKQDDRMDTFKNLLNITVGRIDNYMRQHGTSNIVFESAMNSKITGLATIWADLGVLQKSLQGTVYEQLREDVTGMQERVQFMSQAKNCTVLNDPPVQASIATQQSLMEGKQYMNTLKLNWDKFDIC
ncbi:hypothetical protein DPEC_G00115050 [Dallia pectoralis]|uniref:Uncharacterized protein n=1 Tax=Dallia pectoralis TaxID=75939 RepID=A0ACC2GTU5_DALPE|nr:hypothetical protein DPEC_G00115050 [Dallia pectoralis]